MVFFVLVKNKKKSGENLRKSGKSQRISPDKINGNSVIPIEGYLHRFMLNERMAVTSTL